jgi:hypothetical protein
MFLIIRHGMCQTRAQEIKRQANRHESIVLKSHFASYEGIKKS